MGISIYNRKWFVILATAIITTIFVMSFNNTELYQPSNHSMLLKSRTHKVYNWRKLSEDVIKKLSKLGRILYLGEEPPKPEDPNKIYKILIWKYGKTIDNRHMKRFSDQYVDPFEDCSVSNCKITYDDKDLEDADIVIFHLHRMKEGDLPKKRGSYDQIWAFLTDESPHHTFMSKNKMSNYNGVFNWSMTYRMDSDIPVPYGRTILKRSFEPVVEDPSRYKRKDVLLAILGSNCGGKNGRWDYVKELRKHIKVDVYGKCGDDRKKCPGHFKLNCRELDNYLFYLAFENSNCKEYVTEKLWWNAYEKKSIPIVMGAGKEDLQKLLPPNSYLDVEEFAYPKDLAAYILYLNKTEKYKDFYMWRNEYEVLNEHGYFQSKSYHYCRVCEALNYNKRTKKVYENLDQFWNAKRDCRSA